MLVVAEVDRVEPLLYPLLRRDLLQQGGHPAVLIGDKLVGGNHSRAGGRRGWTCGGFRVGECGRPAEGRRPTASSRPAPQVDFHESFRLVLVTRNAALQLPPDAAALLAVTNFSVTVGGLTNQLLSATLQVGPPAARAA